MERGINPTAIATYGMDIVTDRYLFRAIVIETIRATVGHIDPDILETELRTAYNSIITELKQHKGVKWLRTHELVDELKYREGVEFMMIGPDSTCEIVVDNGYGVNVYDARRKGPEIVLRVID